MKSLFQLFYITQTRQTTRKERVQRQNYVNISGFRDFDSHLFCWRTSVLSCGKMWWRFLIFCVLVTIILFLVLSSIHGRPVTHIFFHRCCEENIENDKMIFEDFGNTNALRERLVGKEILFIDNSSFVNEEDVKEVIKDMRDKLNVHDPKSRVNITLIELIQDVVLSESDTSGEFTTERMLKNKLDIKSERMTDLKTTTTEEFTIYEKKHSAKDAISELDSLFNKKLKAKDAIQKIDVLINETVDKDPKIRLGEVKLSTNGIQNSTIVTTVTSTDSIAIKSTTVFENETVNPEIKLAPPVDDMIMSDVHDSNDSDF